MTVNCRTHLLSLASILIASTINLCVIEAADYKTEINEWRAQREIRLKSDDGWLTVAGLFFLKNGANSFGSDPLNDIVLPETTTPARLGVFDFDGRTIKVRAVPGRLLTVNGYEVERATLRPAGSQNPADRLTFGSLTMFVHHSGERYAIRLRNQNSKIRKNFSGLRWYPVAEKYRVQAQFLPYDRIKNISLPNILGDTETYVSPGDVVFTLDDQRFSMVSVWEDRELFLIFRDLTSGNETYPAARFLYAETLEDGSLILDFNKAYNPPCAFNPHTTCPLPPLSNRLRTRIEAGELNYHHPNP